MLGATLGIGDSLKLEPSTYKLTGSTDSPLLITLNPMVAEGT